MYVCSVNLCQNSPKSGSCTKNYAEGIPRLRALLAQNRIDLLLAQEPWPPQELRKLLGFTAVCETKNVCVLASTRVADAACIKIDDRMQRVDIGDWTVYNVYFESAMGDKRKREHRLNDLSGQIGGDQREPCLVVGDFNLGPKPSDVLFFSDQYHTGKPSGFNAPYERRALQDLCRNCRLTEIDQCRTGHQEWSFERNGNGGVTRSRIDLAFVSERMVSLSSAWYAHGTRLGEERFTDHSALIVEIPDQ
jgi:exonuclease III